MSCKIFGALALFSQKLGGENRKKKIVFSPLPQWGGVLGFFFHFFPTQATIPYKMVFLDFLFSNKTWEKNKKIKEEGILGKIIHTEAINSPVSNKAA